MDHPTTTAAALAIAALLAVVAARYYRRSRELERHIAEMRGDMHMNGVTIRKDVAPLGKSIGKWNFEAPLGASKHHYRPPFPARSAPYPNPS